MFHRSHAKLAIAAVVVVSLGAAGSLGATGSAEPTGGAPTVHFVATDTGGFESKGSFGNGSIVGFRDRLKADDGTTGHDLGVCTITSLKRKQAYCHAMAALASGKLFFEWVNRESSKTHTIAVVGGTGAYADARGSAVAKESGRRTGITVTLVG
jgi:hypothetical protein